MIDISKMIGFILPDWIADILPGEYPVHTKDGAVKQNFKGYVLVLQVTSIYLKCHALWSYLDPYESFFRIIFVTLIGVPLGLFMGLNRFAKVF